jgi:archaellum component FlaC
MNKRQAKKVVKSHKAGKKNPWHKVLKAFRRLKKAAPEVREAVEEVLEEAREAVEQVQEAVSEVEEAAEEVREVVDLSKMKVAELREIAEDLGIDHKGIKKPELREILRKNFLRVRE